MERILVKNPYTGRDIDVEPILSFMSCTFAGGQQETEGMSTGQTAAKEIQNTMDFFVGLSLLVDETWDQSKETLKSTFVLIELRKTFEAMKEIR